MQRIAGTTGIDPPRWAALLTECVCAHPAAWRARRALLLSTSLLEPPSQIHLLSALPELWTDLTDDFEVTGRLGWLGRWASRQGEGRVEAADRGALAGALVAATAGELRSNFPLTQGLRIDPARFCAQALGWIEAALFQTHYLLVAWLEAGLGTEAVRHAVVAWAALILEALEASCVDGAVVVALLGQNQAINSGERGAVAWFEAAIKRGWSFAVADETLDLLDPGETAAWRRHPLRLPLGHGHLHHSMRFYRNAGLERWAHYVLEGEVEQASVLAADLHAAGDTVWITRDLDAARAWARRMRVGEERAGLIASSQARRLAAYGLSVDLKPDIATWMLAPSADFRSSNMLETVQNQYQIQGLEIDWAIVCWGADLRWQGTSGAVRRRTTGRLGITPRPRSLG